jgi:hypothetical protein
VSSGSAQFDEFHDLYRAVTRALRQFVNDGSRVNAISDTEVDWFDDLIRGFDAEFYAWPVTANPHIRNYLDLFAARRVSTPLRLAAHAFLHVAYDLPRVIADNLKAYPLQDRARLRSLFLRPAPLFRQVFMDQLRQGFVGTLGRPFGYFKPAEIAGYWLLSLRSVAWIHAETLADAGIRRPFMELRLARGLLSAGNTSNKIGGLAAIPKLDNSTLFQVTTPAVLSVQHPLAVSLTALGVTSALAATAAVRWYNQRQANRVAYFGAQVYAEATKALQGVERAPPPTRELLVEA